MIDVTHSNLVQRHIELRFDKHEKIEEVSISKETKSLYEL